jgi:hypothetical protein
MVLTRFSSSLLVRTSAIMSVLIGMMYMPSVFSFSIPINGLGPELTGGQRIAELWGMYAVYGGIGIFLVSFLMNIVQSNLIKGIILGVALIAMFILIVAQLLPLFWWIFVGGVVFSWSSILGVTLHLFLLIISFWGAIVTIHTIERLKANLS